jgi:hypothetical protein
MTYEELENTRKKYLERREQIKQKILKIMIPILAVILLIELISSASHGFRFASIFHMFVLTMQFVIIGGIIYLVITTFKTSKEYEEFKKAYKAQDKAKKAQENVEKAKEKVQIAQENVQKAQDKAQQAQEKAKKAKEKAERLTGKPLPPAPKW